jgi:hypothetical protein
MQLPPFRLSFLMLTCVFGINLATAQDRMRVAIPLFPTRRFRCSWRAIADSFRERA